MNSTFNKLYFILAICLTSFAVQAQTDTTEVNTEEKSVFAKGLDKVKLQKARHLFLTYDFRGAVAAYEELYNEDKNNPLVNYRLGECWYMLRDYEAAYTLMKKAMDKASDVTEDAPYMYAQVLHRNGLLDEALAYANDYRAFLLKQKKYEGRDNEKAFNKAYRSKYILAKEPADRTESDIKILKSLGLENTSGMSQIIQNVTNTKYVDGIYEYDALEEVNMLIANLNFAKQKIAQPEKVDIKNMGVDINTAFDDYGPSVTGDQKTLIFTSRRPDTRGGEIANDGKYYEDIYISKWDSAKAKWNLAENIPGRLNSEIHDASLSISPDGDYIYVYKNFGDKGSGEIFESKLSSSGKWGSPKALPEQINTTYWESSASLTSDGETMYFVSERKKGYGMGDIWMAKKISRSEWGEATNLGYALNTPGDEKMVYIHPEGNILYFASNGHKAIGGYDIYMSEFKNGSWQEPVNLGYPINTIDDDVNFVLSRDSKTAYYSGIKTGGLGGKDIYTIDVTEHPLIKKVREMYVTLTGTITDAETGESMKGTTKLIFTTEDGAFVKELKIDIGQPYSTKIERNTKYKITIKASGYREQEQTISVTDEKKSTEEFNLRLTR